MKTKSKVALAALMLASMIGISIAAQYLSRDVSHRIEVVGYLMVKIYKDEACTEPLTYIDWGTAYHGAQLTYDGYIRNEGEIPAYISWSSYDKPSYLEFKMRWGSDYWAPNTPMQLNPGIKVFIQFEILVTSAAPYGTFSFTTTFTATDTPP